MNQLDERYFVSVKEVLKILVFIRGFLLYYILSWHNRTYHNIIASQFKTIYGNNFAKMIIKQFCQLVILVFFIIKIDCALKYDSISFKFLNRVSFPTQYFYTDPVICNSQFLINGPTTQIADADVQFNSDFNPSFTFGDSHISENAILH